MKREIINSVIKDRVVFVRTAKETGGKESAFEIFLMPGGGNSLHYHKTYAETFNVIEGTLGVKLGRKVTKFLNPGETFTVQPMSLHSFFNPTNKPIRFVATINPGHEGFENTLRIVYGLAEDGLTDKKSIPKSLTHKAIVACMSDMNIPGLFTLLYPLLKRIANKARANGEEQKLLDKYCK